ncbi:MAG: ABC transporter ATP-binding protein, partial [Kiritimatiellaeota bacterium]|nr:ABC transporter ATP-binding protein [Kiritimatiellota bacterium]
MAEPVLQTHQLTKVYRHPFFAWKIRARAVTGLDLRVERGEVFGLLGPNGSGKSTTIKMLLGLLFPSGGEAAVFGRRPTEVAIKARIGFLPEESYLYRFLDAGETLDFFGRLFGLPARERRRRADMLLDMVGLARERERPLAEFSKGMARRVGLATCLINDPELVILDEPTTGLDPLGTREVKDLILDLKRKGKTVLLSSHLLSDVEDVCAGVSILYGGRSRAEGRLEDLLRQEDRAQITARMDGATARDAVAFLRERLGPEADIALQPPAERLEHYFLRIVREAQAQRADTSG